jgi:translation initiation factor IF-2
MRRAPIITIMGHVDHGKTTLLDAFRTDFNKCAEEYGAITQSIGAFTISAPEFTRTDDSAELTNKAEGEVTFIDTPGHEAFVNLRSRGAKVTDIIILVISAVESVQKQTIEVIELAQKMRVPFIIAINKIDRQEADVEAVFYDL